MRLPEIRLWYHRTTQLAESDRQTPILKIRQLGGLKYFWEEAGSLTGSYICVDLHIVVATIFRSDLKTHV